MDRQAIPRHAADLSRQRVVNAFVVARAAAALVLVSPVIFLAMLYKSSGDAVSIFALFLFFFAYLAAVALFIPLRSAIGVRPWTIWIVACVAFAVPAVVVHIMPGHGQPAGPAVDDATFTFGCAFVFGAATLALALASRRFDRRNAVDLSFPLTGGTFDAVQGGSSRFLNHHAVSRAQRYGVDLVQVQENGLRFPLPGAPEDFPIYGLPVHSALSGAVREAVDGFGDHKTVGVRDLQHPFGNHVILESADGVRVVFAHLMRGTVAVTPGQSVRAGDLLGSVGNSGNSTEPHLHVHAEREGVGIPVTFGGRYLVRNSSVKSI